MKSAVLQGWMLKIVQESEDVLSICRNLYKETVRKGKKK